MSVMTLQFPAYIPQPSPRYQYPAAGQPPVRANPAGSALPVTTDLSLLAGHRLLFLADDENLRISMKNIHCRQLDFRRLQHRLANVARNLQAWSVLTSPCEEPNRAERLKSAGWRVVSIPRQVVPSFHGLQVKANADHDLAFIAGLLAGCRDYDGVLIGTGDGDLAVAVARGFKRLERAVRIYSISVPGSTSSRLRSQNDLFTANLSIGADLTSPFNYRRLSRVG